MRIKSPTVDSYCKMINYTTSNIKSNLEPRKYTTEKNSNTPVIVTIKNPPLIGKW